MGLWVETVAKWISVLLATFLIDSFAVWGNPRDLAQEAEQIQSQTLDLLRRARIPKRLREEGSPILDPSPLPYEIENAEKRVFKHKRKVESLLKQPETSLEDQLDSIDRYFTLLSDLSTLWISLGLPHLRNEFALELERDRLEKLPHVGRLSEDPYGLAHYPIIARETTTDRHQIRLQFSPTYIQGLELGALSWMDRDQDSEDRFLALLKYLAVRQLYQNLFSISKYRLNPNQPIEIPKLEELGSQFEGLADTRALQKEYQNTNREPELRSALASTFPKIESRVPSLVNPKVLFELASLLTANLDHLGVVVGELDKILPSIETESTREAVKVEIDSTSVHLTQSSPLSSIRRILSSAQHNALLSYFHLIFLVYEAVTSFDEEQQGWAQGLLAERDTQNRIAPLLRLALDGAISITHQTREEIVDLFENLPSPLPNQLDDSLISDWYDLARSQVEDQDNDQRKTFTSKLRENAQKLKSELDFELDFEKGEIDLSTLRSLAVSPLLEEQGARPQVYHWVGDLFLESQTLNELQLEYTALATALFPGAVPGALPEALIDGREEQSVDQALRESAAELANDLHLPPTLPESVKARKRQKLAEARRKDLENFVEVGRALKLYAPLPPDLSLGDYLDDIQIDRSRYTEAIRLQTEDQNPILTREIPFQGKSMPLYEAIALAELSESSENIDDLIESALAETETQIRQTLLEIDRASSVEHIEWILGSSVLLEIGLTAQPEFQRSKTELLQSFLDPSLGDLIMKRYLGNVLHWGFAGIILYELFVRAPRWVLSLCKKRTPFLGTAVEFLNPLVHGALKVGTAFLVAEISYDGYQTYEAWERQDEASNVFSLGLSGPLLLRSQDVLSREVSYQHHLSSLTTSATLHSIWMIPLGLGYFYRIHGRLGFLNRSRLPEGIRTNRGANLPLNEWASDLEAFQRLEQAAQEFNIVSGFRVGSWKEIGTFRQELSRVSAQIPTARMHQIERDLRALEARVLEGRQWGNRGFFGRGQTPEQQGEAFLELLNALERRGFR